MILLKAQRFTPLLHAAKLYDEEPVISENNSSPCGERAGGLTMLRQCIWMNSMKAINKNVNFEQGRPELIEFMWPHFANGSTGKYNSLTFGKGNHSSMISV